MDEAIRFGDWLKRQRKALDLTQADLADRVSCSIWTIIHIERGTRRPSKELAARLVASLERPASDRDAYITWARTPPSAVPLPLSPKSYPALPSEQSIRLPLQPTPLIGRTQEVEQARTIMLNPDTRLLTLIGPPGVGKTRLAMQVAATLTESFVDGVVFVDLAAHTQPDPAIVAILHMLNCRTQAIGSPLDQLIAMLGMQAFLLVLDNVEQIPDLAVPLTHLLGRCPHVKLLVTSRVPLDVRWEQRLIVPTLMVPPRYPPPTLKTVAQTAATAFFIERVRAVNPAFVLTEANAAAVADLCAYLDGLPLALELAAAQCESWAVEELLAQIRNQLAGWWSRSRDLVPRHRTLHAAVDWSYQLLSAEEQARFAQLGVFAGGWTVEAAAAVFHGALDEPELEHRVNGSAATRRPLYDADAGTIRATLQALQRKQLVVQTVPLEETRWHMLEPIRVHAQQSLRQRSEDEQIRTRHAAYYVWLAEQAAAAFNSSTHATWAARLELEHDNLRAALQWLLNQNKMFSALNLSAALWPFWQMHGHLREGRQWLEWALTAVGELAVAPVATAAIRTVRATALYGAGVLASMQSDWHRAHLLLKSSLAQWQTLGNQRGSADVLYHQGIVCESLGDNQLAQHLWMECLDLCAAANYHEGRAAVLMELGLLVARRHADYCQARTLMQESLSLWQLQNNPKGVADVLLRGGVIAYLQGDDRVARSYSIASLRHGSIRDVCRQPLCLFLLAAIYGRQGQSEQAAWLWGAATAAYARIGMPIPALFQPLFEQTLDMIQAALDPATFERAWHSGQAITLDHAVARVVAMPDIEHSDDIRRNIGIGQRYCLH